MKSSSALVIVAVLILVGGVAWYQTARQSAKNSATKTAPAVTPTTLAVQKGELCPDPPPAIQLGSTPTSAATSAPAQAVVTKKMPRIVDLGADKCIPCKKLAPILEELKKEYSGRVTVEFIDVWKNPKAGEPYKIRVIPTQVFFDADGKEVWRHEGFLDKPDFIAKFAELGVK